MSIEVKQLTKIYGTQKALNNISFKIEKGEIVGFLGPNGAGKSTAMKILTTCVNATEGAVLINGLEINAHKMAVKRRIGYLPEHNPQYLDMYVSEFLQFNAAVYRIPKNAIEEIVVHTGLTPEVHKKIGQLSKGYRQRVGLAAALLHNPDVLILDEPTTGLDPNQLVDIRQLIKTLGKEKTVLLSTHIMQEVEAICDRVLIIHKGKLVADKKRNDLHEGKEQVIEVAFDYRVEEVFLQRLPDIKNVRNIAGFVYELTFTNQKDMRPTVFDFAHDNGLKILQLNPRNKTLESLFRELTAE
jgi:ABC-2 type transport system ATP-binding protein